MGKVYIVGAGPGKRELLTLKAAELIKKADVILHDELIGDISDLLKDSKAIVVNVGKRKGRHRYSQDEINRMLVEYAKKYEIVVRLKGGDPFVFGRGGEEAEFLAENGIEFEVVSGITSAIAVPAKVGIPITHRKYDPAVVFITGTESRERLNWRALAELNATIVVLMGVSNLERICKNLIENGKNPNTPVAIIERGFDIGERIISGKLSDITEKARKENVNPPAIIVIGNVVEIRERLKDYLKFD